MIRRVVSLLYVLISLELTLLGVNVTLVLIGLLLNQPFCVLISLVFLVLAAVETAISLTLVFIYHKAFLTTASKFLMRSRY